MLHQRRTIYAFETDQFEVRHQLSLSLIEPTLDPGNPVVPAGEPGAPDEAKLCYTASVDRWQDGYGMWYQAEDHQGVATRCFASSPDGLQWTRHGVVGDGIFNTIGNSFNVYNDGDRFLAPLTNLGRDATDPKIYQGLQPHDLPDGRLRDILQKKIADSGRSGFTTFIGVATSDDGQHWQMPQPTPRVPMMLEAPWICRFQGRYIMNAQTHGEWFEPPIPGARRVAFMTSDDLIHWELQPGVMANIAHEPILGMGHVGIVPIKCIDDRLLIGLGGRFDDAADLPDMHFEVTLLYSTNGLDWKPVVPELERRNWIRRGRPGDWDCGGTSAMGLIEHGDDAAVYYAATTIGNCAQSSPSYDPGPCQVGRVRFKRDRFAALQPRTGWNAIFSAAQAAGAHGSLTTRPLAFSTDRPVTLNIDIPDDAAGYVQVDLLTPDGEVSDTTRLDHGGVTVPLDLPTRTATAPLRLRIALHGGAAPDRVPRLYAIEY